MKKLLTIIALLTCFLGAKAEYQVSLQEVPFWNHESGLWGVDAPKNTQSTPEWVVGESTGVPYGDASVCRWADLSRYNKLVITYTEGEPRVMMNRDMDEGQYSATEEESHLIEYPKCVSDWAGKYFTVEDEGTGVKVLTVDLKQIVNDKGFAHLHAIKGANWANVTVLSMMLLSEEEVLSMWIPYSGGYSSGDVIIDDNLLFATLPYSATSGSVSYSYINANGQYVNFDYYMQMRVQNAPSAENLAGTEYGKGSSIVLTAKDNVLMTVFYRRQMGGNSDFTENDNKDIKLIDQTDPETLLNSETYFCAEDGSYAIADKTYKLQKGHTYTLWATGTTMRVFGIKYKMARVSASDMIDVTTALQTISAYTDNELSSDSVYVKGMVSSVEELNTTDGYATFTLGTPDTTATLRVYRVMGPEDMKLVGDMLLKAGDEVVVCAQLNKYVENNGEAMSTVPQLVNGYIYSINGENKSQITLAANELTKAVKQAQQIMNTQKLTSKGINMLETAIGAATQALAANEYDAIITAKKSLETTIVNVLAKEVLFTETITFDPNEYKYYYDTDTIAATKAKLIFRSGNGSTPRNNYGSLRFYNSNTLDILSEDPIVEVEFNTDYSYSMSADKGEMISNNYWKGDADTLTFTNTSGNTIYINSIVITYDNPTNEVLLERLTAQLVVTNAALQQLSYPVPGRAELEALAAEATAMTVETDAAVLKNSIKQLKSQTEAVVALDQMYKNVAAAITQVEGVIQANQYVSPTALEEANALIAQVKAGLATGAFTAADIQKIIDTFGRYAELLNQIYLVINVEEAGTLGDLILDKVDNFNEVKGLSVSGKLNSSDLQTLKGNLTNLTALDLYGTNLTTIDYEQFRGKTALQGIVLPSQLQSIGQYAFYGCTSLVDVVFPTTLKTIDEYAFDNCYSIVNLVFPTSLKEIKRYAFYNCSSLENVNFPEGLTYIGYNAFYCSRYDYYYDEYGNYHETRGKLKEISLPSTLTTLGSSAFGYQTNLEKVTFADGLTTINSNTFNYCTALRQLKLPKTLESIGSEAFYNCSALKKVELPEGLTKIESNAFSYCSSLEEVVLPSTLQYVYYPFYNCNALTKMTAKAIVPAVTNDNSIMGGRESQCTLTVPNLSIKVYKQTSYWSQFNIIGADILPDNIEIVSDYRLNWPDSVSLDYKPNVSVTTIDYSKYGSLTVTGNSTLSAGRFNMFWDENAAYSYTSWDNERQRYYYNRNRYASLINNATVRADNVSIYLSLKANRWAFLSFPYDVKVSDIGINWEGTPFVIRKYDGQKRAEGLNSETWVNMTADSTLHAGQGYIWQSASTDDKRDYTGFTLNALQTVNKNNIFANGDLEVPLAYYESEFAHNRSWNLIGNPYPCFYDIRAMQTSAPITIWNNYYQNYEAFSPMDDAYILNPGQAFFVQRPVNEEKITFLKEGRQINTDVRDVEYGNNRAASVAERNVFNVTLTGNEMSDRTRFVINGNAQMDYEAGRDASKFMSLETQSIQLYSMLGDVRYAINERPLADGLIELGIQVCAEGTYTITLDTKAENEVYLIDRATGTEIRIDGTEGYSFYAEKGIVEGRFAIRMGDGVVTGINAIDNSQLTNDSYYNLKGQRIANPTKGLYIKNGKKMIVK